MRIYYRRISIPGGLQYDTKVVRLIEERNNFICPTNRVLATNCSFEYTIDGKTILVEDGYYIDFKERETHNDLVN